MTGPIVKVIWKDEGEFGPITMLTQKDLDYVQANPGGLGIPYDPNRPPPEWYSRAEAQALAREHNAEYEES